jgi:hypothetical protein
MAIKVTDFRLQKQHSLYSQPYEIQLQTYDYNKLRKELQAHEFETLMITKFGGIPQNKKGPDKGVDGKTKNGTPIQVKQYEIGRKVIDEFVTAAERYDAGLFAKNIKNGVPAGYIIAFDFSKDVFEEIARLKNKKNIIIELKYVNDITPYDKPPIVSLTAAEMEQNEYALEATAKSETGIDFYSWAFNHDPEKPFNPDVLLDTEGKQVRKFTPGKHQVAVKAVDKKGLEGTDSVKLNVKENT